MQHIITNTYHEKLIFTSLEGIRWKISKGLREEWWIELVREGGVLSLHPWIYCSEFQICFCMIWFQYFDFSYQFVNIYFNPPTTFLIFSQSFVDLTTYTNSLIFVPLPCEISVFFTPFFTKFAFNFFICSFSSSRLRQTKGEWTFIYFYYCNYLISLFSYIYIFIYFQFGKIEIESRKIPFHAG